MSSMLSPQDREDCLITLYFGRADDYLKLCLDRAYGDFKRTLRGINDHPRRDEVRGKADKILIRMFVDIRAIGTPTQEQFDDWHQSACVALRLIYQNCDFPSFYVGHAQKWLNMTFKYVYVMGDLRIPGFGKLYDLCHVPFDNILMHGLRKYGFENLPCAWSQLNNYKIYLDRQRWVRRRFSLAPLDVEFLLWMGRRLPAGALRD